MEGRFRQQEPGLRGNVTGRILPLTHRSDKLGDGKILRPSHLVIASQLISLRKQRSYRAFRFPGLTGSAGYRWSQVVGGWGGGAWGNRSVDTAVSWIQ